MADFCNQCNLELFGNEKGDFVEATSQESWDEGFASIVICEGCGVIQVDPAGNCVSVDCIHEHGKEQAHGA